jgi:hypothetical protein
MEEIIKDSGTRVNNMGLERTKQNKKRSMRVTGSMDVSKRRSLSNNCSEIVEIMILLIYI